MFTLMCHRSCLIGCLRTVSALRPIIVILLMVALSAKCVRDCGGRRCSGIWRGIGSSIGRLDDDAWLRKLSRESPVPSKLLHTAFPNKQRLYSVSSRLA